MRMRPSTGCSLGGVCVVWLLATRVSALTLSGVPPDRAIGCDDPVPVAAPVVAIQACGVDPMLLDGLVLRYGFDRDDGGVVMDLSGFGRTGIVHGASWMPEGVGGGAYRFDHAEAWIGATDAGLPSGNAARSVSWWFTTPALHTDGGSDLFSYGTQSPGNYFYFGIDWRDGRRQIAFSPWGWVFLMSAPITEPDTWYHAVFTYDGQGGKKFYLDGIDASGFSEGGGFDTVLSGLLRIGPHAFSQHPFTGMIDEVRMYDRALTPEEVASLHAMEQAGMGKPEAPLLHYRFDVEEDLALDSSPLAQHGVSSGVSFDPDGIDGGAAYFDGSASISIPDMVGISGATALTWSAWIKLSPDQTGLYGIMGNTVAFNESMYLVHDARVGKTRSYVVPASRAEERIAEATNVVDHAGWQHLVGTYDGRTIRLFVQGVLVGQETFTASQPIRSNQVTFAIGDTAAGRGWRFVGSIDDVRIYPRAFSADEVRVFYQHAPGVGVVFSETRNGDCPATITRVWSATDSCGNSVSATQVITVLAAGVPDRDSDGDGLLDSEEKILGTNPNKADTDGDGRNDGLEVERGTNPLVVDLFPTFVRNDFDGDAISDLGVYDHLSGTWHLLRSRDGYTSAQYGFFGTTPVPGDYDGDGKADLAVYDPANAVWYINGSAGKAVILQWGFRGTVPVPADYDGDGRTDLAVYHGRLGLFYVNGSRRGKFYKRAFLPGGQPVVGDFDGDRAADFAVYQPSSAKWKIQLQAGGVINRVFGDTNARGLATDYDGDGRADLATFHAPTGWWTISGSRMGSFKVAMPQAAGGLPVTGDYNGNNKAEAVVFLPLTAEWIFSGKGPGQVVRIQFGGASSTPLGAGP